MKITLPTKAEAREIKNGNIELRNKYFLENYSAIVCIAKSYCRKNSLKNNLFEDVAQECFLYFAKFNFDSTFKFVRSVKDVAVYIRFGGEKLYHQYRQGDTEILTILDEPILKDRRHGGEPATFGEILEEPFDIVEKIEPPKQYTDEVFDIAGKYLTERERQAFNYFYYTDLTAREVGKEMGLTINGAQSLKNSYIRRLKRQAYNLREDLLNIGYNVNVAIT